MKMKMKKYGKISLIFEFPTSKLVYVVIFMKIREKKFNPSFKKILTNPSRNED